MEKPFLPQYPTAYEVGVKADLLLEERWQTGFGFAMVQPRFAIEPRW